MKKTFWLFVASIYLIISPVRGNNVLPDFLPVGNNLFQWATTNQPISISFNLSGNMKASNEPVQSCGDCTGLNFGSYSEFLTYATGKCYYYFCYLYDRTKSTDNVRLRIRSNCGLNIDTNLVNATSAELTSIIVSALLTPKLVVPIDGLVNATVAVGDQPPKQIAIIGSNGLDLSGTGGNGRIRLTLQLDDGQTATYTQNGTPIMSYVLTNVLVDPYPVYTNTYSYQNNYWWNYGWWYDDTYWNQVNVWENKYRYLWQYGWFQPGQNLIVQWTPGTDTTILCSTDLVNWTNYMPTFGWNSGQSSYIVQFSTDSYPLLYFRTVSY